MGLNLDLPKQGWFVKIRLIDQITQKSAAVRTIGKSVT